MEEKTYTFDPKHYAVRYTAAGYITIGVFLFCVVNMFIEYNVLLAVAAFVSAYNIFETFITNTNPNQVVISDEKIIFRCGKRQDEYLWSDIHDFRCKENPIRKQIYIRINKDETKLLKGRYWVFCYYFNDCDELFTRLCKKETEIHPDTVKAYARNGSVSTKKKD